jgi:hypothetical protein
VSYAWRRDRKNSVRLGPAALRVFVEYWGDLYLLDNPALPRRPADPDAMRELRDKWDDMVTWARQYDQLTAGLSATPRDGGPNIARAWRQADAVLYKMALVAARAEALTEATRELERQQRVAELDAEVGERLARA